MMAGNLALRATDDVEAWSFHLGAKSVRAESDQAGVVRLPPQTPNNFSRNIADQSHSSPSSLSPKDGTGDGEMSDTLRARTVRAALGPKISGERVDGPALTLVCTDAIQAEYGDRKSGIKSVANDAGCNERTAKNWWQQKNLPDLVNALNLSKEAPTLATRLVQNMASHKNIFALLGELHRLAIMEADHDADFAIEYGAFLQRHVIGRVK